MLAQDLLKKSVIIREIKDKGKLSIPDQENFDKISKNLDEIIRRHGEQEGNFSEAQYGDLARLFGETILLFLACENRLMAQVGIDLLKETRQKGEVNGSIQD